MCFNPRANAGATIGKDFGMAIPQFLSGTHLNPIIYQITKEVNYLVYFG